MSDALNHAELSRDLALALGYHPESVRVRCGTMTGCEVYRRDKEGYWDTNGAFHIGGEHWYAFDYRDPSVVVPLIKWLMLEGVNVWNPDGIPTAWEWSAPDGAWGKADTLEAAVAKAVIAVGRG